MASDNFTVQVGNLTDDPELRFTQNGTPVANFRLAVNQRVKEADGSWRDGDASFFKVNVWRDQAENGRGRPLTAVGDRPAGARRAQPQRRTERRAGPVQRPAAVLSRARAW